MQEGKGGQEGIHVSEMGAAIGPRADGRTGNETVGRESGLVERKQNKNKKIRTERAERGELREGRETEEGGRDGHLFFPP